MKKFKFTVASLLVFTANAVFSAPSPPPGGTTGGPVCWPPPCVPIDNGIIFLIAAGALYGAKKIYDFHKKTQTS